MRNEDLQDALGQVKDSLLEEADTMRSGAYKKQNRARQSAMRKVYFRSLAAVAACFCIVATGTIKMGLWSPLGSAKSGASMDMAEYEEAAEPAEAVEDLKVLEIASWENASDALKGDGSVYGSGAESKAENKKPEGFDDWTALSNVTYLAGADENVVYSPVNLYSMIALTGSIGSGEQQEAILDLLQVDNLAQLQRQYNEVWELAGDQALLANSLWLSDRFSYSEEALKSLSEEMKLSSYIGQMGSDELNQMLQKWVNEHTNNLLSEQMGGLNTDSYELLTLVTTLYEKAEWVVPFETGMTRTGDFTGKNGIGQVEYMHGDMEVPYIKEDGYVACKLPTKDGGGMWVILPDDDVDVDKLLKNQNVQCILQGNGDSLNVEMEDVALSMPKFDYSSTMYMEDGLAKMGVNSELIPDSRLFQLAETDGERDSIPYELCHAVRVKVDEQGGETAAVSALKEAADEDRVTFYVNRSFLFSMVSSGNVPLCTGVINDLK